MAASLCSAFCSFEFIHAKVLSFLSTYMNDLPGKLEWIGSLLLMLAALLAIEVWLKGWKHCSFSRLAKLGNSQKTDILSAVLYNLGLLTMLGALMSGGIFYFFIRFLRQHVEVMPAIWTSTPPLIALLIYYLTIDFFSYWVHRVIHRIPILWILHRYHHSATEMTMLTTFRTHPLYDAVASLCMAVPLLFLKAPIESTVLIVMTIRVHTLLLHSNMSADWGWLGRWVVQSPAAHRVHHSKQPAHYDKNFGATLIIWDRIFGTLHLEPSIRAQKLAIGVADDPGTAPPLRYILDIYREFISALTMPVRRALLKPLDRAQK